MNQNNISAAELFLRVRELLILPELEPKTRNKMMHDTLILCCHEGVKETKQAFGNLFSQVDYLCKAHGIKVADKIAIQTMRRHSNSQELLSSEDLKYDARALAIYWAHLDRIYYANDRKDAAKIGFDDEFIYEEIDRKIEDRHKPMIALMRDEALGAFRMWEENAEKTEY
jgi:hypothetical protein